MESGRNILCTVWMFTGDLGGGGGGGGGGGRGGVEVEVEVEKEEEETRVEPLISHRNTSCGSSWVPIVKVAKHNSP
jgi:hypothetical protein